MYQPGSAAYHIIGNEYNGMNQSMDEMIDLYGANYENVEKSSTIY